MNTPREWWGGPDGRDGVLRALYVVAVLFVFGAYLYSVRAVLSPLVIFFVLLFL